MDFGSQPELNCVFDLGLCRISAPLLRCFRERAIVVPPQSIKLARALHRCPVRDRQESHASTNRRCRTSDRISSTRTFFRGQRYDRRRSGSGRCFVRFESLAELSATAGSRRLVRSAFAPVFHSSVAATSVNAYVLPKSLDDPLKHEELFISEPALPISDMQLRIRHPRGSYEIEASGRANRFLFSRFRSSAA
jgi:hypothetical protein